MKYPNYFRYWFILSAFILGNLAHAQESGVRTGTEFFYQPAAGVQTLTPSLNTMAASIETGIGADVDTTAVGLVVSYEYGLSDMFALGARLSYTTSQTKIKFEDFNIDSSTNSDGLNDFVFTFKGNSGSENVKFRYGAELSVSPGDNKVDSGGDSNQFSGGHEIEPYVGVDFGTEKNRFGGKFSTTLNLGKKSIDNDGTKVKASGGESTKLAAFYEHKFNKTVELGTSLSYTSFETTKYDDGTDSEGSPHMIALGVYVPVHVGIGSILPTFSYMTTTADSYQGLEIDSFTGLELGCGYRMEF